MDAMQLRRMRQYYTYLLASRSRTLYTGVTNDLLRRMWKHKTAYHAGFTREFQVTMLVYFECHRDVRVAITREKQIKRWPRIRKVRLIEQHNPDWRDLSADWFRE